MMAVKEERKDRNESPLIQIKAEEFSPSRERAHYAQAEEPSEEGETSEVGETTSEEDHEGDARPWGRRKKEK